MNIRAIALALLLCLCLTACGGEPEESRGPDVTLETAAGLDGTEHLLTIDNREIPAWRYLYWLAYTCDQIAQSYTESGGDAGLGCAGIRRDSGGLCQGSSPGRHGSVRYRRKLGGEIWLCGGDGGADACGPAGFRPGAGADAGAGASGMALYRALSALSHSGQCPGPSGGGPADVWAGAGGRSH